MNSLLETNTVRRSADHKVKISRFYHIAHIHIIQPQFTHRYRDFGKRTSIGRNRNLGKAFQLLHRHDHTAGQVSHIYLYSWLTLNGTLVFHIYLNTYGISQSVIFFVEAEVTVFKVGITQTITERPQGFGSWEHIVTARLVNGTRWTIDALIRRQTIVMYR